MTRISPSLSDLLRALLHALRAILRMAGIPHVWRVQVALTALSADEVSLTVSEATREQHEGDCFREHELSAPVDSTSVAADRVQRRAHCPRVCADSITADAFYERFLKANRPCIISGLIGGWGAVRQWRREDGTPDIDELTNGALRDAAVPVDVDVDVDADADDDVAAGARRTVEMTFGEFAAWWSRQVARRAAVGPALNPAAGASTAEAEAVAETADACVAGAADRGAAASPAGAAAAAAAAALEPTRYLRDWHLVRVGVGVGVGVGVRVRVRA